MNSDESVKAMVIKFEDCKPGSFYAIQETKIAWQEVGVPVRSLIMSYKEISPGVKGTWNRHNMEEIYYILEGHGELDFGGMDKPLIFGPRDTVFIKENVLHRPRNTDSKNPVKLIAVCGIMQEAYREGWGEAFPDMP